MKKIFLMIMSIICLNSCYSLVVRPVAKTTATILGTSVKAIVGNKGPSTEYQYRDGYRAYMVEEYKDRVDNLMNDILQREWEKITFVYEIVDREYQKEEVFLPKGLTIAKDKSKKVLIDKETGYGLPVRFIKDQYPCFYDRERDVFDLKSKEAFFIKGIGKDYYKIESESEKGNLLEQMIIEKNNVQRGCN